MEKQIKLIYKLMALSKKIKPFPSEIKIIKLMEEVGELSECITKLSGYKTNGESNEDIMKELWKEICDIFIMIVSLGEEYNMPLDKFEELLVEKTDKWWHKHLKQYITDPIDIPEEYKEYIDPKDNEIENLKKEIAKLLEEKDKSKRVNEIIGDPIKKPENEFPLEFFFPSDPKIKKIFGFKEKCLHELCKDCNGTGFNLETKKHCIHYISCQCKKCTPFNLISNIKY